MIGMYSAASFSTSFSSALYPADASLWEKLQKMSSALTNEPAGGQAKYLLGLNKQQPYYAALY